MITVNYAPQPYSTETQLMAQFPKAEAKAAKEIIVELHSHTKTRISISLRHTIFTIGVNTKPAGSEHLKFHEEKRRSFATGNVFTAHYFVLSKKQSVQALEEHLKNIVKAVFELQDEDEFKITVYENSTMRNIRAAAGITTKIAA